VIPRYTIPTQVACRKIISSIIKRYRKTKLLCAWADQWTCSHKTLVQCV